MFLIFLYIKVANLVNYDVVACYPVQAAAFLIDVKYRQLTYAQPYRSVKKFRTVYIHSKRRAFSSQDVICCFVVTSA